MSSVEQYKKWDGIALKAATARMGEFAWPTVVYGLCVFLGFWLVVGLVIAEQLNIWLGTAASIVLTYLSYTTLHEAVHGSISGKQPQLKWFNNTLGYLSSTILTMPMTAHRYEHLAHHRHCNDHLEDPDAVLRGSHRSPLHLLVNSLRFVYGQYSYYFRSRWPTAPKSEKSILILEIVVAWLPRFSLPVFGFWEETMLLLIIGPLLGSALLLYLFAYIVHRPHDRIGRYVDTSTIRVPGRSGKILTWLWVFQNYHSIHHLFPKVPFYRYVEVFDEIETIMVQRRAPIYRLTWKGLVHD